MPRLQAFDEARRSATEGRRAALPGPPPPKQRISKLAVGWILLAVLVVALLAVVVLGRDQIMQALPQTEEYYKAAGLIDSPVPAEVGEGLELRDVTSVKRLVDGQQILLIEGSIVNVTNKNQAVPQLRASVTDAEGKELTHWFFSANAKELEPNGSTTFQTSTESPTGGVNLSLIFHMAEG